MSTVPHFAGMPTKPDVDRLMEHFGIPKEDQLLPWGDIEGVIGHRRGTHRFATVLSAWRRRLFREHNVVLDSVPGEGLVALSPDGRVEFGVRKERCGVRLIGVGLKVITLSDRGRMTPENSKAADAAERRGAAIKLALATSAKAVQLPEVRK